MAQALVTPQGQQMDMGPMRIEGIRSAWINGGKKHVLSVRAGESLIDIVVSAGGRVVTVEKDGVELIEPYFD